VSSLTIERLRAAEYEAALKCEDPDAVKTNLLKGAATGVGFLSQLWGIGFMFWWGKNLIYFQFVIQYIIHSTNFMFV
jgi:hypothetical protein